MATDAKPEYEDNRQSLRVVQPLQLRWQSCERSTPTALLHELLATPTSWRASAQLGDNERRLQSALAELAATSRAAVDAISCLAERIDVIAGALAADEEWLAPTLWVDLSLDGLAFPIDVSTSATSSELPAVAAPIALALRGEGLAVVLKGTVKRLEQQRCAVIFDEQDSAELRSLRRFVMRQSAG
ncbi:MAG: PilZ domain-containing protein [Pseudomonadaceae bacterium]|nr:PilZ domain-containing protein [Pseudomonadaceae bacterium]